MRDDVFSAVDLLHGEVVHADVLGAGEALRGAGRLPLRIEGDFGGRAFDLAVVILLLQRHLLDVDGEAARRAPDMHLAVGDARLV